VAPVFTRIADLTWKRPKLVLAGVGLFALLAVAFAHDVEHHLKAAGFSDPSSESERAARSLDNALGYDPNPGITMLVQAPDGGRLALRDPAFRRQVDNLATGVERVPGVGRVVDPLRDRRAGAELIARDGRSLVVATHLSTAELEDSGGIVAERVQAVVDRSRLRVAIGGFAPSFNEVNDRTREDLTKAELIAFPLLALLLLIVFRGVVAAGIPLLLGGISIVGTLLVLRVMSVFVDTSLFALNIATGLSLGLAVDYALLMVSRYREEIGAGGATREAHRRTVETAGRTAVFSGFTVAAAMAALVFFPQRFLYSIGVAGASVGILSATIALLVVPSLLALLGTRIDALSIRRGAAVSDESDGWYRLARGVMRHPVLVALVSGGLMLLLASPLLGTQLTGPSAQAVPPGLPAYEANTYVESHYPSEVNNAVTVVVEGPAGVARLARLQRRIAALDGVSRAAPFVRASRGIAFSNVGLRGEALSPAAQDALEAIRDLPPPGRGTTVLASGTTARFVDLQASLAQHLPLVVGLIAATTLILLFLLTGSVLLPLKTLLMNTLTLGATLGIIVLAFQEGWLDGLFAYTGPS
jgi:RND superfamily putative drug exporter